MNIPSISESTGSPIFGIIFTNGIAAFVLESLIKYCCWERPIVDKLNKLKSVNSCSALCIK
jgi:hypothetical protein